MICRSRRPPWRTDRSAPALFALTLLISACRGGPSPAVTPAAGRTSAAVLPLQHDIDALLAAPALGHSYWGVLVKSLKTGDALYTLNTRKLMMPASNMKIVTLAASAERLGWDYTYETRVFGVGSIAFGVLDGDLVVVGSGDPSINDYDGSSARLFQSWAERLKVNGVGTIGGRIIGDDNAFDDEALGAGWTWDDLAEGYAAGVGALQFNENAAQVTIAPGAAVGERASVAVAPRGSGLLVRNLLKTTSADTQASLVSRRLPGSTTLELRGSVPLGVAPIVRNVSVDNPTLYFVTELREALIANGIEVRGPAVDIDDIADRPPREEGTVFLDYRSPPLSALATTMMKVSLNIYAETLLKTLGRSADTATIEEGRTAARATLQGWGVSLSGLIMVDGSGLSRYNFVTPELLVTILTYVDKDERLREPFEAALPVAGRDGTLARRMKGSVAEGNARAKTGSLANARALSGYVRTAEGEPLVFSIIANNFDVPASVIDQTTDAIVVRLAEFTRHATATRRD